MSEKLNSYIWKDKRVITEDYTRNQKEIKIIVAESFFLPRFASWYKTV